MDSTVPNHEARLYVEFPVDENTLVTSVEQLLGLRLTPLTSMNIESDGVYWIDHYDRGFAIGLGVAWRIGLRAKLDDIQLAVSLSKRIGQRVATDVPEGHPETGVPWMWCVADPAGGLFIVGEDRNVEDRLVLDEKTARRILATRS